MVYCSIYMGVSKNRGKPPKSSILIGFSIIFTIHFGVPLFLETPIYIYIPGVSKGLLFLGYLCKNGIFFRKYYLWMKVLFSDFSGFTWIISQ